MTAERADSLVVVEVDATATRDLRRRVLYGHLTDPDPVYPGDGRPGAFHLGVVDDGGTLIAVASYSPEDTPARPGRPAYRLRGMAVDRAWQGQGLATRLFTAGVEELLRRGAEVLWANARDTALAFYEALGMQVVGESFLTAGGLPHHLVMMDIVAEPPT